MDQDDRQDEIVQLERVDCIEGLSHNFFHFTTDLLSSHAYHFYC
jgi:hypothetical protein